MRTVNEKGFKEGDKVVCVKQAFFGNLTTEPGTVYTVGFPFVGGFAAEESFGLWGNSCFELVAASMKRECLDCGYKYQDSEITGLCPGTSYSTECRIVKLEDLEAPASTGHSCSCELVDLMKAGCTCGAIERYKGGLS